MRLLANSVRVPTAASRKRVLSWLVFACLLVIASFISYVSATQLAQRLNERGSDWSEISGSPLAAPEVQLDLGTVYETTAHSHALHIKNVTDRPVSIHEFVKSCDCLSLSPDSAMV